MAQLYHLSGQTLVDGNGVPYAGAKATFLETGTTTPKNTYSNAGLTSANANPVVADANGRFGDIYLLAGRYKVVLATSADVTIDTLDPVDATSQLIAASSAPATTYAFLRYHNTTDGHVYRRNAANSAWIDEGLVDSLTNASTVTQALVGTDTSTAMTPDSTAALWQRGSSISSATTLSLPSTGGMKFAVTGTTTTTGISSAQGGRTIELTFAGGTSLTHNGTSFILLSGANEISIPNAVYTFVNEAAQNASGSNWRCTNISKAQVLPKGWLHGLTLSRASTTTFGVAVGTARNEDTGPNFDMVLSSAFTKSTSSWAVGTGNGGLDTGAIGATTWYHVHMIRKDTDGTIDFLFSTSVAAPTMPSGYTSRRRIGSLLTNGSSQFVDFDQIGDEFIWDAAVIDVDAANPGTSAVSRTLSTPLGVKVTALINAGVFQSSGSPTATISSLDSSDQAPQAIATGALSGFSTISAGGFVTSWQIFPMTVRTNTSSQIRTRLSTSGANDRIGIITRGWLDTRGKDS